MGQGRSGGRFPKPLPSAQAGRMVSVDMAPQARASEGSEAKNPAGDRRGAGITGGDKEEDLYLWVRRLRSSSRIQNPTFGCGCSDLDGPE